MGSLKVYSMNKLFLGAKIIGIDSLVRTEMYRHLKEYGFYSLPKFRLAQKEISFGKESIYLPTLITDDGRFCSHMYIGLRVDIVEEIEQRYNKILDPLVDSIQVTIGLEISHLWNFGVPGGWIFDSKKDIPLITGLMINSFEKYGIDYFKRYSIAEEILATLSDDSPYGWANSLSQARRCRSAITLAAMLGKDNKYLENLINNCLKTLKRTDYDTNIFLAHVKHIESLDFSRVSI